MERKEAIIYAGSKRIADFMTSLTTILALLSLL